MTPKNAVAKELASAFKQGFRLGMLLIALVSLWVAMALALGFPKPSGTPFWLGSSRTVIEASAEHASAGFLVGGAALKLRRALIGAAFQPLIDIDHMTAFANIPVDPRIGHSLILMGVLVLVGLKVGRWPWGSADLALFVTGQFLIHFAVAPPGFPLLAPFVATTFYFPSLVPGVAGIAIVLVNVVATRRVCSGPTL